MGTLICILPVEYFVLNIWWLLTSETKLGSAWTGFILQASFYLQELQGLMKRGSSKN